MAEDADQQNSALLPRFRGRKRDREQVEQSEKDERKRAWLPEVIGLVVDLITSRW